MKIKVINPNSSREMAEAMGKAARSVARPTTEVVAVNPEMAPASIESYYDEFLCVPGILDEIMKGDRQGFNAYIIGCYGDPGLNAAREVTDKPVIGIAEASLYTAAMLAARFSIVTIIPRFKVCLEEMVRSYGFEHRVANIRTTPLYVLDAESDQQRCLKELGAEARRAMEEDDAEAILLGCGGFAEFANQLEQEIGIPVLDGVVCATKMAEALVDLGRTTSKRKTYRFPETKPFTGMLRHFGSESPQRVAAVR